MGIYDVKGELISAELDSYEAGFLVLREKLEELKSSPFACCCSKSQLEKYRELLGIRISQKTPLENAREMVKTRLATKEDGKTLDDLRAGVRFAGFDANIIEDKERGKIKIEVVSFLDNYLSYDEMKNQTKKIVPCHLEFELDVGIMDWNMLEGKDLSFSQLDGNDFTWESIDLKGHLLNGGKI